MGDPKATYAISGSDPIVVELNQVLARIAERLNDIETAVVARDEINIIDENGTVIHQFGD